MTNWQPVIGLEVHVQLATKSKAFSGSGVEFGAPPNSLTDPTVLGLPGALPAFNRKALESAIALGLATGCEIRSVSRFARKHYFYPDLPKGYQISQFEEPLCEHGGVEFPFDGEIHRVRLTRIHLEEDAGKSTHSETVSLVDLNRAGVPLCEVVSEPDIRSADEAAEYMRALRRLVRCLGISHGDMEKGHLRCDANVSLRPVGSTTLGTRTELKNINSFRFVQRAIEHEIARQTRILDAGDAIVQETRLWDADAGLSRSMRGKEEANDYRYFPDPDLPPMVVLPDALERIRAALPELPAARYQRYTGLGIADDDAHTLIEEPALTTYFDTALSAYNRPEGAAALASWILGEVLGALNRRELTIDACLAGPDRLAELLSLIDGGTLSGKLAKQVFADMMESGDAPGVIVERRGLVQITDPAAIEAIAQDIIDQNPGQVAAYRGGKTKLLGYFVGQVMKQTGGRANPGIVNQVLTRLLAP